MFTVLCVCQVFIGNGKIKSASYPVISKNYFCLGKADGIVNQALPTSVYSYNLSRMDSLYLWFI